jgi:hypothetical protein
MDNYGNPLSATQSFSLNNPNISATPIWLETDKLNNLYVSYSQGLSGLIIRYLPNGKVLDEIKSLYANKIVTHVLCDNTNHNWSSVLTNPTTQSYNIEKRSFEWNLLEYVSNPYTSLSAVSSASFGPYTKVKHMCIDRDQNLWFTHSYNKLTKITNNTYDVFTVTLTSQGAIWAYPGKQPIKRSIAVMPEINNDDTSQCLGICSDYIKKYKDGIII